MRARKLASSGTPNGSLDFAVEHLDYNGAVDFGDLVEQHQFGKAIAGAARSCGLDDLRDFQSRRGLVRFRPQPGHRSKDRVSLQSCRDAPRTHYNDQLALT